MSNFSEDPFQMDDDFIYDRYKTELQRLRDDPTQIDPLEIPPQYLIDEFSIKDGVRSKLDLEPETYPEDLDDVFDASQLNTTKISDNLTPPENFAPVVNNIYRSSFPQEINFPFVKRLKLKSILCLIPEEYPENHIKFLEEQGIKLFQLGLSGNKEPFVVISHDLITEALKIVLNPENHPILIHCNRGKHRTGCLVGILRRLQQWSLTIIFDEYRRFAAPKERPMDQQFIELYNETDIVEFCQQRHYLPLLWG